MHDLTPQLRTRLNRVERAVGVFVLFATVLLLVGLSSYVYHTGQRKGWFVTKATYCTTLYSGVGLAVGDPVTLWGFKVGEITRIDTQPPEDVFNVYVEFNVRAPYFGYLYTEGTRVRVTAADFLGKRAIEVTKGANYVPTHLLWPIREYTPREALKLEDFKDLLFLDVLPGSGTNPPLNRLLEPVSRATLELALSNGVERIRIADRGRPTKEITAAWDLAANRYLPFGPETKPLWLPPDEMPAISDRVGALLTQVENSLTQHLAHVLSNSAALTANADALLLQAQPLLSNLTVVSAQLTNPAGSLGDWLLPVDLRDQFLATLRSADGTLTNATTTLTNASAVLVAVNTNLVQLTAQLDAPLANLSTIISNLNTQVQANTNFVSTLNSLLLHTDELIQGFKRHWLLRGAFKTKPTNAPPAKTVTPRQSPKGAATGRR
ncbi:MAG: MCE family protein [Verrucomicrobia bacterium]|nr:MCE family protein [Verrucomicrobiota bacterium]